MVFLQLEDFYVGDDLIILTWMVIVLGHRLVMGLMDERDVDLIFFPFFRAKDVYLIDKEV